MHERNLDDDGTSLGPGLRELWSTPAPMPASTWSTCMLCRQRPCRCDDHIDVHARCSICGHRITQTFDQDARPRAMCACTLAAIFARAEQTRSMSS